jgi:hypothetical protein
MTEETRPCSGCGEAKPLDAFCRDEKRRHVCRACDQAKRKRHRARLREDPERLARQRERQARWRAANPDRVRELKARWRAANPDYQARWRAANPDYQAGYLRRCKDTGRGHEPVTTGTKRCRVCDEVKPVASFKVDPRYVGGRVHRCNACRGAASKRRRLELRAAEAGAAA